MASLIEKALLVAFGVALLILFLTVIYPYIIALLELIG